MNGLGSRRAFGLESDSASHFQHVQPTGRAMANGYRQDVINGFEPERPRYNPLNTDHPQSSPNVDLKDPIQVHLLTETALSDSREWVILSQEEVDDLKKQCQSIVQRIEQTRANLAIQSKYRDAARSMAKLYSPGKRMSILSDTSGTDAEREADAEKEATEQRCEALSSELFSLEKRLMEPQRRLFQHTAGILQLTHRGPSKNKKAGTLITEGLPVGGIPGSPESMYTYDRESMEIISGGIMFDDRSLYLPLDQPFGTKAPMQIPQKSPQRKETIELREESDRLRETNMRLQQEIDELRANSDALNDTLTALQHQSSERLQTTAEAERQMEDLNSRLREIVVRFNPSNNSGFEGPPPNTGGQSGNGLLAQIEYLSKGLSMAQQEQESGASEMDRQQSDLGGALAQFEGRMVAVNSDIQHLVLMSGSSVAPIPSLSGAKSSAGVDAQLSWLEAALPEVESGVSRAGDAANGQQAAQQVDAVLVGLWDILQSGFAEQQRKREERKASRAQMGLAGDEDDMSGDESPMDANEKYSLQALASKVQWLYSQTTRLREHKSVLKRQIKQQRELNSKSDAEKDMEIENKSTELESVAGALQRKTVELQQAQRAADGAQEQLAQALMDLNEAQSNLAQKDSQSASATRSVEQQLAERTAKMSALEQQSAQLQTTLAQAEASVARLTAQLKDVSEARDSAAANADKIAKDLKTRDQELEELNIMLVEMKTEATIAKAELDGAYGSRSQRAKDVAAYAKSAENEVLQTQLDNMKKELTGTLKEYEDLTKDTLAAEREKQDLEGQLDEALAVKTALESEVQAMRSKLEAEVTSLKEELDAEKLKVSPGGTTSRTGAALLSEQFRATMKSERKKFQEELRGEQAHRRKLEEELRALRRAAMPATPRTPGRSTLSPLSPR